MIAVDNLCIRQGSFTLSNVGFRVPTGEYAVLMGKTGCGKTTLVEAICGLRPVLPSGRIRLMDRDVSGLKPAERGIGYVPQDGALFPTMTVRDHLAFALSIRRWERRRIEETVTEIAALLGVQYLLNRKPAGLSGGEVQRVALGRALSFDPAVLLLDEPLSALDEATRDEMYELLRTVRRRTGVTALHVTHNVSEARALGDRIFVLKDGKVTEA